MAIDLKKVRVHNLKSVSLTLPTKELICFTGVSGSGKSSLAFDTIYVEGQRRYVESLSQHARRFLGELPKPDCDSISGISPTISIEQKTAGRNPRSTVGTITEIYDYLRVLFARVGVAHCPISGERVQARSKDAIIQEIQNLPKDKKIIIAAPYLRAKKGELKDELEAIVKKGFSRVRIDGSIELISDIKNLDKSHAHDLDIVIDRLEVSIANASRISDSVTTALEVGLGSCIVIDFDTKDDTLYSTKAYSPKSGISYEPLDPQDFSFNSPQGMCPDCQGMGLKHEYLLDRIIDPEKSIAEDCCSIASSYTTVRYGNIYDNLARLYNFSVHTPWKNLSEKAKHIFLHGTEKKWTRMIFTHPVSGARWQDTVWWKGVLAEAYDKYQKAKSENYKRRQQEIMHLGICPSCKGSRIKAFPAATRFQGKTIQQITDMPIEETYNFFKGITLSKEEAVIGNELIKEITGRLEFLVNVGLEYLQLSRTTPTLSGGEAQRVRLASQIGSGLVGITYILDEPSIGLHPRDNKKLIESLKNLRDKNNTVIVVEHDEETILASDYIVDVGPKAGIQGGSILYAGPLKEFLSNKESLTAEFVSGRKKIEIPKKRGIPQKGYVTLKGATHHNLKNVDVLLPLGCFIAVTGVSGSGKSSLFLETLYPALSNALMKSDLPVGKHSEHTFDNLDKIIEIDQSPIGRTPRSNPATYVGVFDEIRALFAQLPQSMAKGYKAGRFSFNVKEGSCSECHGLGMTKVDMDFLEDSWVPCTKCNGMRFDEETLSIRYKEKNIRDILEMDVLEALDHFANIPSIATKLETLKQVGLDYIKLGQSSTTLSGGEAQRIKLAKELSRPATGKTLYILDEPTTGLHFYDIQHLLKVLHSLVDRGNTVVVIEHNMDLVKTVDLVIDMGPGSGEKGGTIIAQGTPEEISKQKSPTGIALKHVLTPQAIEIEPRKRKQEADINEVVIKGACQNNLKSCSTTIPHNKMTVVTGPSGAGKSSFAFETIYAEGQRRYVESLSPYVRQFVKQCSKPHAESIEGLSPTVAIEQRLNAGNPRSTVGTMTEIYDFLRLLYARIGIPHCPKTGHEIKAISKEHVVEKILSYPQGEKLHILAPIDIRHTDTFEDLLNKFQKQGFLRIRLNKEFYELGSTIPFDPKKKNELLLVVDRFKVDPSLKLRMLEAIATAAAIGKGKLIVMREDSDTFFNLSFAVVETGESYPEITPQTFAFNTPYGMCPECQGLGFSIGVDLSNIESLHPHELLHALWGEDFPIAEELLDDMDLPEREFFHGSKKILTTKIDGIPLRYSWKGINSAVAEAIKHHSSDELLLPEEWQATIRQHTCNLCNGDRLNALARHVTIKDKSIANVCNLSIDDAKEFIKSIKLPDFTDLALKQVHEELCHRLEFLDRIGLSYLSLHRSAPTLSGGEAQRVRIARQIGSGLTGVLYVLDEPTIGLHPQDCATLISALDTLKAHGNTLLVVEHDDAIIQKADHVIEFGPGSGKFGGTIVRTGKPTPSPKCIFEKPKAKKKKSSAALQVKKAKVNNLQSINVDIPLNTFTCLTGVSGSGKSTLMFDILAPQVNKIPGGEEIAQVIVIDQKPIGNTLRSDVATYLDVLTPLRQFFATLPEARMKGLEPKHFSTYHRSGMCTSCYGLGYKKVTMHFLPPVKIPCPECHGLRLNSKSLHVQFQEKNLGQILQMTVEEVRALFVNHPKVTRLLDMMIEVGLGYLTLGQEIQTLSGGEAQRIKLAYSLSKRTKGHTLYLLDEPTTGLHKTEIAKIISLLHKLVQKGHTVIAIEHNLDFIASSEYIVDLGPGAGDKGGKIVATGTPEELIKCKQSITGQFLKSCNRHST